MKYYCNGKIITAEEAAEIEKQNNEYMASGTIADMAKCQFVFIVND